MFIKGLEVLTVGLIFGSKPADKKWQNQGARIAWRCKSRSLLAIEDRRWKVCECRRLNPDSREYRRRGWSGTSRGRGQACPIITNCFPLTRLTWDTKRPFIENSHYSLWFIRAWVDKKYSIYVVEVGTRFFCQLDLGVKIMNTISILIEEFVFDIILPDG